MGRRFLPTVLAAGLALGAGAAPAQTPGAFDLLAQVRRAYADLESYNDLGEIETTSGVEDRKQTTLMFFETAVMATGDLCWRTHGETDDGFEERVVWRDGLDSFVYSSLYQQYKPVPSLVAELAHSLGHGSYDALVVPLLLAGADDALADPTSAVVDRSEPCGNARCWVISLTRMAGAIESELHVHQQTKMIHQVVVRLGNETDPVAPEQRSAAEVTIRVRHHANRTAPPPFEPPDDARHVADWEPTPAGDGSTLESWRGAQGSFEEAITVALLSVVTRIVDPRGEPIPDLEPDDLIVRVGKREARVLNLEWTSSYQPPPEIPAIELAQARALAREGQLELDADSPASPGKLVVFFLQVNFEPSRIAGHLKILPDVERLLNTLHPDDRVAIVSFDSHLKLWQDFTRDRRATFQILKRAISYGVPTARRSSGVSLLEHLDLRAAADAASPEKALLLTGEALALLPGTKDLVYLGWGLGRYGTGGVRMTPDYRPAVRALYAARTTVFVLDVSQADYHSLEIGLQNVAAQTGGTYARTLHFASQSVDRLARTIGGHYLVTIDRSAMPGLRGRLTINLRDRKGRVYFRPMILG